MFLCLPKRHLSIIQAVPLASGPCRRLIDAGHISSSPGNKQQQPP